MSTRSRIAVIQPDGKVKSVYCHSDGYCSHNGNLLLNFHNTEEKANELVSLGDLSFLDENLNPLPEAQSRRSWDKDAPKVIKGENHSFDNPQKSVTTAYHRDRKEDWNDVKPLEHESLTEYNKDSEHFESYNYLWMNGAWHVEHHNQWILLTSDIVKNDLPE